MKYALLVAAVLAGCLTAPQVADEPPEDRAARVANGTFAFGEPMLAIQGCGGCYEPSVTWAFGYLYATSANGHTLARYNGQWESIDAPELVGGASGMGDVLIQTDGQGRLWWSSLLIGVDDGDTRAMQVARSDDGITWALNVVVEAGPGGLAAGDYADRQWLAFTPHAVIATCNCPVSARTAVMASMDDGQTWQPRPDILVDLGRPGPAGPAATHNDTLVIPFLTGVAPSPERTIQGLGVAVAISPDGGTSWTRSQLALPSPTACCAFPSAATAPDGTFLVAWTGIDGRVMVADGKDPTAMRLTSWNDATQQGVYPHPWVAADQWGIAVAWFALDGDIRIRAAVGQLTQPMMHFELDSQNASNTDFAHLALGPDGEVAVVWSRESQVWVSIGR